MRRWLTICGLLLVASFLLPAPADAQYFGRNKVTYEDFTFQTLETEHFIFHFYPEEERAVRDAARMAERWYDRHSQLFLHRFDKKKPVILYANDADFQQTNVTNQAISPATGGFTESVRERVVMPLSPSYGETNHVLGHELVHSFQYDLALNSDSLNIRLNQLPLWLVEGMAEYFSVGRTSPHTAMWMRDAILRDDMPTYESLANPREYFPYRFGQAFTAYIGGKYGDQAVTNLFKRGGQIGLDSTFTQLYGITGDSLVTEWSEATREAYAPLMEGRTHPDSLGTPVLSEDKDAGRTNIAPALSPDGRYVAFISERSLFAFNLYVADAETGEVIAELDNSGTTSHFNALRFINSAGTWSPDGRRLAFISYADGDNQITIWNVQSEEIERSVKVKGVTAMKNPAWSPDGSRLAFSGTNGGISDLYVLNLKTDAVRQLTNDRYADLQPTWSPDGETLAFTTDRGDTDLRLLSPSKNMNLGLIDVKSREIDVREPFGDALHHNPQFAPDGRSLYFISDQDGFKDVYRMTLNDTPDVNRVTHLKTGVSGITATSPAMSVAAEAGDVMVSVYHDDRYTGVALDGADAEGTPMGAVAPAASTAGADTTRTDTSATDRPGPMRAVAPDTAEAPSESGTLAGTLPAGAPPKAGVLPPYRDDEESLVASNLNDPRDGLPTLEEPYDTDDYDSSLSLEGISPPRVGASVGGPYGGAVSGGVALRFGDMLGNQTLITAIQAQGTFRDIGGGVSYINRGNQLNWGASASHQPIIAGVRNYPVVTNSGVVLPVQVVRRLQLTSAGVSASYPLSPTRRFELGVGGSRFGYGVQVREFNVNEDLSIGDLRSILEEQGYPFQPPPERDTRYLASTSLAYVRDFSRSGLTGPIMGGRWRLEVSPKIGSKNFITARADVRRYFNVRPFTFAFQALHVGNYGAGEFEGGFNQLGIANEYIGYPYGQGFVRGYNIRDIDTRTECPAPTSDGPTGCPEIDRLVGTRMATVRAEVRVPLLGPERLSLIPFRYVPTTLALFADGGVAWNGNQAPDLVFDTNSNALNIPVTSAGVAARFNVLGNILLEAYYARPFQRPERAGEWGLRITPGW